MDCLNTLKAMDKHTAGVLVKDSIFHLTMTSLAPHLWGGVPLSDVGISPESIPELSRALGLDPTTVNQTMTLEELTDKVVKESPLDPKIITVGLFDLFF